MGLGIPPSTCINFQQLQQEGLYIDKKITITFSF